MVTSMRVDGVDISHWQSGGIDYAAAKKAGVKFVYHKATEGVTVKDSNYSKRRAEAKAAGIPFGAYHFARANTPTKADAVAEAKYFLSVAKPVEGDLYPVLDLETTEGLTNAQLREWATAFIGELSEQGFKCVLYTNFDLGNVGAHLLWTARYNNTNTPPKLKNWDIWQFSNGVYGVPKSVAGFGNVDLNTMRAGLKVSDFQIPKKETVPPVATKTEDVLVWHASLEFSDSHAQREADIKKIFTTAKSNGVAWITGTEGFEKTQRELLKKYAPANGYNMYIPAGQDSWIAVRKDRIKSGYTKYYSGMIVDGKAGLYSNKGTVAVYWEDKTLGDICAIACHYVTKGTPASSDPDRRQRIPLNKDLAKDIGRFAKLMGGQGYRVFYGGDQNIEDSKADTFFGQPLTSCWDDLKKYPGTGHGTIDVIARWNGNAGCSVKSARSYNDTAFFLNTDHFLIEAVYKMTTGNVPVPSAPDRMNPNSYYIGAKGDHVTWLGQRLVAHGFGKHYTSGPGPTFTEVDRKNVEDFQKAQGWKGADADGFPGKETLKRLAANPAKPTPTPTPTKPVVNLAKLVKAAKTDPKGKQGAQTYAAGVKVVEAALLKEGLLDKKYASDGSYGTVTVKAYSAWQKKLGYKGKDADGIPGATSLKKLGSKHGFTVK